jgi:hypothetical protein
VGGGRSPLHDWTRNEGRGLERCLDGGRERGRCGRRRRREGGGEGEGGVEDVGGEEGGGEGGLFRGDCPPEKFQQVVGQA